MTENIAEIGLIGGTGIYDADLLDDVREIRMSTPFGETSDFVTVGIFQGKTVAFIPRHGQDHKIPPHQINSRANIWALKELGVTRILSPSAVGSLKEQIEPGDMVFPDQFIDRTKNRPSTFYDGGKVCHISTADPFCSEMRSVLAKESSSLGLKFHDSGTYVCIEGPRFSTRAESQMFRSWNADVIGMTLFPECVLAREAEICYSTIATSTDYDVWADKPVSTDAVMENLSKNIEKTKMLLRHVIPVIPIERKCNCKDALKRAFI